MIATLSPLSSLYLPENCAWCKPAVSTTDGQCAACGGNGSVLVYQPSSQCPPCEGTGKANGESDSRIYPRCDICGGTGWARYIKATKAGSQS